MDAFNPRNVAKFVAKTIVHGQVAAVAEDTIIDHTRFEEDDMLVNISSHVVGWYVADKLSPLTDRMVDKAADWIVARKERKAQKDTAE